jgi:S-formylglutathione hydrolase
MSSADQEPQAKQAKLAVKLESSARCCGGQLNKYSHDSTSTKTPMTFSVFLPPAQGKVPAIYCLAGLSCSDDTFLECAGAIRYAAREGVALVCPDTSPRGANIEGDSKDWDFGVGAGFYLNAAEEPWKTNYNMFDYVTKELPALVEAELPINSRRSVMGHSMGGHGALVLYLRNPGMYQSASAFAPICNPSRCPWGIKAFTGYLGSDQESWKAYDATELIGSSKPQSAYPILVDQGTADKFLDQKQLLPENLSAAAKKSGIPLELRMQQNYDHSYWFIQTFVEDHVRHHAKALLAQS